MFPLVFSRVKIFPLHTGDPYATPHAHLPLGLVSARAPELEAELLGAMKGWTAGRRDLGGAQVGRLLHRCLYVAAPT